MNSQSLRAVAVVLAAVLAAHTIVACRASTSSDEPPATTGDETATATCDAYASAFGACLAKLGLPSEEVRSRTEATRNALAASLESDPASAATVAQQCRDNRSRLAASCH